MNKGDRRHHNMKEFEIEVLFHSSSSPKRFKVTALYTKGNLLCCQKSNNLIVKYPLCNIFQVAHEHGEHCNSSIKSYTFQDDKPCVSGQK